MQAEMSFIWNDESQDHESLIINMLKTSKRFDCVVAFAKWSGFKPIKKVLVGRLKDGMTARFMIGLSFCQSDPQVLKELLALKAKHSIDVLVSTGQDACTFHPKVYRFDHGRQISVLIGSANLTSGGFSDNYEISTMLKFERETKLFAYMNRLVKDGVAADLTPEMLDTYRKRYDAYHILRQLAEKRIKRSLESAKPGLDALQEILREMKVGGKNSELTKQVKIREKNREQARKILKRIEPATHLSQKVFLKHYNQLAGRLWHSGGLQRSNTRIAKTPNIFLQIVQTSANSDDLSIAEAFEKIRKLADNASGIGPNVLTEILQTYDNAKFAIMNKNSVAGMRLAGLVNFPEKPNRKIVDGKLYAEFCKQGDSLRRKLNLANLSELDAVFNYAYWQQDEPIR
jgi:HKD family nuclease